MAKRARRIRYVARARRRRRKNPGIMGVPLWLIGGGIAAFFLYKKVKAAPAAAPAAAPKVAISVPGAELKLAGDLYSDVGGTLSSAGLGSLG